MVYLCPKTSDGEVAYDEKDDWLVERVNQLEYTLQTIRNDIDSLHMTICEANEFTEDDLGNTLFILRKTLDLIQLQLCPNYVSISLSNKLKTKQKLQQGNLSPTDELGDGW